MSRRRITIRAVSRLLAILSIVALAAIAALIVWQPWESERQFDSARWKALAESGSCPGEKRGDMVSDLRSHHLRLGMTWPQVRALLGGLHIEWSDGGSVTRDWVVGRTTFDCATFYARFVNGKLVETGEGQT
jgi:hypothetical protein